MRLIDADELKLCYTGSDTNKASYLSIRKMIDTSKTTYDIDKVLKQLEEQSSDAEKDMQLSDSYSEAQYRGGMWQAYEKAIEIVKQGGVAVANNATVKNDDVCEWRFEETNCIAWHCDDKCTTYNQVYIKDLKIALEDFECKCPYCGKRIKVVE